MAFSESTSCCEPQSRSSAGNCVSEGDVREVGEVFVLPINADQTNLRRNEDPQRQRSGKCHLGRSAMAAGWVRAIVGQWLRVMLRLL